MNHQIIYQIYYAFVHRNFSVLRFNFRGVGQEPGLFRPWPGRAVGCGFGARLGAVDQPGGAELLDRRLLVRCLDRHAAADAAA